MKKIRKYFVYILKFFKSPVKGIIVTELLKEVKQKGLVTGIQSFLHLRVDYFFPGYDKESGYDPIMSLSKESKELKIILPYTVTPKVSIVIPIYNQVEHTYYCIRSILEHNEYSDYEVIIANDNSSEDISFLSRHIQNLIIISNPVNLGFLKNCNNAASKARGEYILFLNNDTLVKRDWLYELLSVFENFQNVGLVGSKLIYPNDSLQEAGGIIWQDGTAWNYGNTANPHHPEYNYIKESDYVSGASMMILKSLWDEIGGFDERYVPAYNEDSDLCFEVRKHGYRVYYNPFSVVVHYEGISHGKDVSKGVKKYQIVNHNKFVDKWRAELDKKSRRGQDVFLERDRSRPYKHVLVIDHDIPMVDKDAGSRTISNFVDTVLGLGYRVVFWTTNPNSLQIYKAMLQRKGIEVIWGERHDYLLANMHYFHAVLLSRSHTCIPYMILLRNNGFCGNIIYYGHDLGYLRIDQETSLNRDVAFDLRAKTTKAEEDFMYEQADHSLVISYEEMEFLKTYVSQPLHYIPPYYFDVADDVAPFEGREGIFFIGGFNHTPNQDAMRWFLNEIYPALHNEGIPMTITGSNVPSFIFEYKKQFKLLNIESNISVENLDILYNKTRLSVVPLRVGAGVKGKVIEAMSKGMPLVGTFIAFEGIPKDEDFPYKGCNSAEEMIQAILRTYNDKARWEMLSAYGRSYVAHNFNKGIMKQTLNQILSLPPKRRKPVEKKEKLNA
jgi:GT2 family glycosyltransferase